MNNNEEHNPALVGNTFCNYLGLKDDPQTCLAYPSSWNYCQRATPPESVRLDHQSHYCLIDGYVNCVIYQKVNVGPLPPEIRGSDKGSVKPAIRILAALLLLSLALVLLWLGKTAGLPDRVGTIFYGDTAADPSGSPTSKSSLAIVPVTLTPLMSGVFPTWTSLSLTYISSEAMVASFTHTPSPLPLCGNGLDTPFGLDIKFSLHQALGGDSLNKYAVIYNTSVEAIQAVNFRLPLPLRRDWIVVIPLKTTRVAGVPAFEP